MASLHLQEFISKRIRQLRLQQNLTQEQLEEKAKLGFSYIQKLENKPTNLKIDTVERIILALETDLETFFNVEQAENSPEQNKLFDTLKKLPLDKQEEVYKAIHTLVKHILD